MIWVQEKIAVAVLFQQHPPQLAEPGFMSDGSNDKTKGNKKGQLKSLPKNNRQLSN